MSVERRITTEHPLRYSAFENPRVLFLAQETTLAGSTPGREFAAYYEPVRNVDYPFFDDGIYAEISSFQGKSYLAAIHATQPRKGRTQKTEHRFFYDFMQAVEWVEQHIPIYQDFCTQEVKT